MTKGNLVREKLSASKRRAREEPSFAASVTERGGDFAEGQDFPSVLADELYGLASLGKCNQAGRTPVIVQLRRPLIRTHQLMRSHAHVNVASFHNESIFWRKLRTGGERGQFSHPHWLACLLMLGKGACRTAEGPRFAMKYSDCP